jgi:hypothetical protein
MTLPKKGQGYERWVNSELLPLGQVKGAADIAQEADDLFFGKALLHVQSPC